MSFSNVSNNTCPFQEIFLDLNRIKNTIETTKNYALKQSREVNHFFEEKTIADTSFEGIVRKEGILCIPYDINSKIFITFSREELFHISKTCIKWNSLLKEPLFLKKWSKIHLPTTYQLCKNLDSKGWDLYGRNSMRLEFNDERMAMIAKDQHLIYSINKFSLMLMSPVLLEIAFQPSLYIARKFQALLEIGLKPLGFLCNKLNTYIDTKEIQALMDSDPTLTFYEAKQMVKDNFQAYLNNLPNYNYY